MTDPNPNTGAQFEAAGPSSGEVDETPQLPPEVGSVIECDKTYYVKEDPMAIFLVSLRIHFGCLC